MLPFIHRLRFVFALLVLALFARSSIALAAPVKEVSTDKYSRLVPAEDGREARIETAVRTFRSKTNGEVQVDLVSVIHVGEKDYYRKIDKLLDGYDVVLYECVRSDEGSKPKKAYSKAARALGLDAQGEHINYDRKHFVHADMSKSQLRDAFRKRGLKFDEPNDDEMAKSLSVFPPLTARWLIALMMMEENRDRPASDAVVILDRNQVALAGLAKALAVGHKKIAIFYGVNHMPDFEQHLKTRFDMEPAGGHWLTAWRLPPK